MSSSNRKRLRQRDGNSQGESRDDDFMNLISSPAPSTLPPSSPPPFSDAGEEYAIEDNIVEDDDVAIASEDDEGEDLFGSDMENDYNEDSAMDRYEMEDIDDEEYEPLDIKDRLNVEQKLMKRDLVQRRRTGRVPAAFLEEEEASDPSSSITQRRRRHIEELDSHMTTIYEEEQELTLEELKKFQNKSISSWIHLELPRRIIKKEFRQFLLSFCDESGSSVYGERIRILGESNHESLEISYLHLAQMVNILAYFLANSPMEILKIFDMVAFEVVLTMFPDYDRIHNEIHVRVADLPSTLSLRDLRQNHLNCLIRVHGIVSRRSSVFPQLKYVKFDCLKCGIVLGPFYQDNQNEVKVSQCSNCSSKGPFRLNSEQTIYRNYQKITLQESPGSVPPGRLPRHREIILLWDLIDSCRPGEEVEVTGIYRHNYDASLNVKNGFPVFATIIEANHINKKEDMFSSTKLTEEDQRTIRSLGKDPSIGKRIFKSIAPSIYGHENIKMALALALFGGVAKDIQGKHRIRGDINVLMLGDPGTAKSQFLKYVEKISHRAVFTTGQGASAVGLTASVRKDPSTREWTLEGGALVLADKGVCLIDEFDKMNDSDRTSIHEAMEQQSISISKAGIVATLQARSSVIAAANPIRGRYNPSIPFSQNVELTDPILSRFDVLCVVKDSVDPIMDELLAKFVVQSHIRSHPLHDSSASEHMQELAAQSDDDLISQDILKKYIMYARDKIHPKLHQMDQDKIAKLYGELRRESLVGGSIPITVRHIESMIRMAEAHAKMHLREYIRADDIDLAIKVMLESFISTQKFSIMKNLRRSFSRYLNYTRDNDELLYFILSKMLKEKLAFYQFRNKGAVPPSVKIWIDDFETRARELKVHDARPFYQSKLFLGNGFLLDTEEKAIVKNFE